MGEERKIEIPAAAGRILGRLEEAGYEAYVVGGCVRDSLLGRTPQDWDITTSARPEEVERLFRRTIGTGIQHGTVTVMVKDKGYEVTTYRLDGAYEDSRHPADVTFTDSLLEDLKRRDFTVNAMAYSERRGLVDAFDGVGDLEKGLIRSVGQAGERFTEDALRIMRAVRFAAQLGFSIEEETYAAAKELAPTLRRISHERIQAELNRILLSDHPGHVRLLYEAGITRVILPEFDALMELPQNNRYHCYSAGEHTIRALEGVPAVLTLRLTMLLHDMAKGWTRTTDEQGVDHFYGHAAAGADWAEGYLRDMKYDNRTIGQVSTLIRYHDSRIRPEKSAVRKLMNRVGTDLFPLLEEVWTADLMAKSEFAKEETLPLLEKVKELADEITADQDCLSLKDLAVNGGDLIRLGMRPGPRMGEELEHLLELVLEDPSRNTRETLLWQAERDLAGDDA